MSKKSAAQFLYLDIGNTRVKWARAEPDTAIGQWLIQGVVAHDDLPRLLNQQIIDTTIDAIWCANVAGEHMQSTVAQQLPQLRFAQTSLAQRGLCNGYREPSRLGIDRWLAALAAYIRYPQTGLLIINMGTATTIDLVSAHGVFLGGWIIPGLATMSASLHTATAQLPDVCSSTQLSRPSSLFGDDTFSGIQIGCQAAQIGAIRYAWDMSSAYLSATRRCVLTGGASHIIADRLDFPVTQIDDLVLQGLQIYANDIAGTL